MEKKRIVMLVILVAIVLILDYPFIDRLTGNFLEEKETSTVERVIDGDTLVILNDTHVRLLGINTPEKKEKYHDEAKNFLESLVLNKTISLEYGKEKKDKYGRTLAYIYLNGKNVNFEIVRNGFANPYILDDKMHEAELRNIWNECIAENINLCEKSDEKCSECIELKEIDVKSQITVFYNKCDYNCDMTGWNIKDEGRKNFYFPNFVLGENKEVTIAVANKTDSNDILYWKGEDYVWTSTGDTLFLRDKTGKLVLWKKI